MLYIILLIAELAAGFFLLAMTSGVTGWVYSGIVAAVWAALTVLLIAKLKRADSKRKLKILLALVMLIPAIGALAGLGWFIWQMSAAGLI